MQEVRLRECEERQQHVEHRLLEVEQVTMVAKATTQHLGEAFCEQKKETDMKIEALEKRLTELMSQQETGAWSKWRGTGAARTGDGDGCHRKSIGFFACKWGEREGP